ncbi:MAG TPA: glycosyltransferase family 2 protein [Pyrinomonadaceae bacterium]|nr:glycosyltransferase family 2 protein [Pyrinomonadaceae bacterium]
MTRDATRTRAAPSSNHEGLATLISVVVPCYNEEAVLPETHARLVAVLEQLDAPGFEIVYVDDGSRDTTLGILRELQTADARVRVVGLSRNFGHQVAVSAGLEHAVGRAVVVIDADLQDPPEVILEMFALWREGYQVVYGVRTDRAGETRFKLWTARAFYRLHNRLSETKLPLDAGDFRLLDRRVIDALLSMPERDRFLRGMISWIGFKQAAVMFARQPRRAGTSKYPLLKMLKFAADGVISFSFTPLRLALWTGFLSLGVAFAGIVYALVIRLYTEDWVRGWASIFTAVLFLGGVQLITLGIVGEYIGRIYAEVKRRPLYVVQERLGFETRTDDDALKLYDERARRAPDELASRR